MSVSPISSVLLVDDDEDLRLIAKLALADVGGWRALMAASGPEGLALAATEHPDVILLDVMMPGMDGAAVLARLREDPATATTPVIFMTAKSQQHEIAEYLAAGAIGVIVKPFDPLQLAGQVRAIVEGAAHG